MSEQEWLRWIEFYKLYPFDDYSRFYRPASLIATSISRADPNDLLDWLERKPPRTAGFSAADLATMEAFGMKPPRKD